MTPFILVKHEYKYNNKVVEVLNVGLKKVLYRYADENKNSHFEIANTLKFLVNAYYIRKSDMVYYDSDIKKI